MLDGTSYYAFGMSEASWNHDSIFDEGWPLEFVASLLVNGDSIKVVVFYVFYDPGL